jgi:transposase
MLCHKEGLFSVNVEYICYLTNDKTRRPVQFKSVTDELVARYTEVCSECQDITLVFDKGNNSKDNEEIFKTAPFHFTGSLTPSHHMDLLKIPLSEYLPLNGLGISGVSTYWCKKKVLGVERTVVVTYNETLYLGQMHGLMRKLFRCIEGRAVSKMLSNG